MAVNVVTVVDPITVTGELLLARRTALGLSRDKMAELLEVKSGAYWRFEVRDVIRPDERAHLVNVADRWLTEDAFGALQSLLSKAKSAPSKVAARQISVASKEASSVFHEEDEDVVQWADALKPDRQRRLEIVFPYDSVSPTTLSIMDNVRRVSNSEVSTFKRCRRKWWLVYVRGLRSVYEPPFGARATGTRGHAALAAWYRPDGEERVNPRDALEIIIESERAQLEATTDLEEGTLERFSKDAELERVVIEGYVEWLKETGVDSEYRVIGSERYLEAPLPEVENMYIIARLDARVVRTYDDARLFIDHKFVASIPAAVRLLPMNEQMMWYVLLEQLQPDLDPDQRVGGALYNMLRRCKRTATAQPPFYQRVEVHHSPVEIENFRRRLVGTLDDMRYCRDELDIGQTPHQLIVYPTPTKDCAWDCPFLKVCTMADDGSRFEDALAAHYVVGDPYGYYTKPIEKSEE